MKNFLEVFEEMARRKPDHIALIDQGGARQMTLREMENLIDSAAARLQSLGFPKGSFLIICMGRCSEFIAAYFGAIKAGMAVVPVTPEYPQERIDYIREDCHSPFTITEDFFAGLPVGKLSGTQSPQPEDIVCMNYTSGSTGKPKGVYYSFRCISKNILRAAELFQGLDRVITAASAALSFAAVCNDCLAPLLMGGTVHILSDEVRKDVQLMSRYYEEHRICCGNISPGMLRYFGHTSCLKRVLTTGERVVNISSDQYEIWCVYGLTEAYTAVSYFKIDRPYENTPIGKPFGGVKIEILDSEGNEVPDGTEGEIHVTGYLADGYYGMPVQCARLRKNPVRLICALTIERKIILSLRIRSERVLQNGCRLIWCRHILYVWISFRLPLQKVTGESGNLRFAILPDASYSRLPVFDFAGSGCETRVVRVRLMAALCECREKAAQEGASLPELMLLAALKAVSAYNGCDRVSVNWIYSGRDIRIKNDMSGLLLSSMPVPADLSACPDRASLLTAIQEVNRHNLVYNDLCPGNTGARPVTGDTLTANYIPFHESFCFSVISFYMGPLYILLNERGHRTSGHPYMGQLLRKGSISEL